MSQLSEYLQHHFLLAGAAAAMAIVVLAYELRHATRQQAAVSASELVRLVNSGALLLDVRAKSAFDAGHIANDVGHRHQVLVVNALVFEHLLDANQFGERDQMSFPAGDLQSLETVYV